MLILSLSLLSTTLAGGLVYGAVRYRRLHEQLLDRTDRLVTELDNWRGLQRHVQYETGLSSVDAVVRGYRQLCGRIGYSLHNWGTELDLTPERSIQLGALGNLLRELASSQRIRRNEELPQVKAWLPNGFYGTGQTLKWADAEFALLLDGLTLPQLMQLTTRLLDKSVCLEQAFMDLGICLLAGNRWWAERVFENYKATARNMQYQATNGYWPATVAQATAKEIEWRALIQPRRDAQAAFTKRCLAKYTAAASAS